MDFKLGLLVMLYMMGLSSCDQLCSDDIIQELINRLDSQQKQIDSQRIELENQRSDMNNQRIEMDNQKAEIKHLKYALAKNQEQMVNEEQFSTGNLSSRSFHRRQLPGEGTIAFTAGLDHSLTNLGVDQNIVFNLVYTNIGNGYNANHGTFVAPVSGVYVFHLTIFTRLGHEAALNLVVNGVSKVDVYVNAPTGQFNSGSQTLVIRLNKGDDVAVQNVLTADYIFDNKRVYNTFSGFLLQDLSEIDNTNVVG